MGAVGRHAVVTGAGGMLGADLVEALRAAGWRVTALDRAALDITDREACRAAVVGHDVVLNAAAYTAVDAAETEEERATLVNAAGAENLALACAEVDAVLVQYSTDYVFSGDGTIPYPEDAPLAPVSAYGRSKALGERLTQTAHPDGTIVLRTAWLYGEHGGNFVTAIRRRAALGEPFTVVDDQWGQPTWTRDVAHQTVSLLNTGARNGILHATSRGQTTWSQFAREILATCGVDPNLVISAPTVAGERPAARPHWSVLGHDEWARRGIAPLRDWKSAFADAAAAAGWTIPPTATLET